MIIETLVERIANDGVTANIDYQNETVKLHADNFSFDKLSNIINILQIVEGRLSAHG